MAISQALMSRLDNVGARVAQGFDFPALVAQDAFAAGIAAFILGVTHKTPAVPMLLLFDTITQRSPVLCRIVLGIMQSRCISGSGGGMLKMPMMTDFMGPRIALGVVGK